MKKTPKTIINKAKKIRRLMDELLENLNFQGMEEENKRDFYKTIDQMRVFQDNL